MNATRTNFKLNRPGEKITALSEVLPTVTKTDIASARYFVIKRYFQMINSGSDYSKRAYKQACQYLADQVIIKRLQTSA